MADACQIKKNNGLSAILKVKCASLMFLVLVTPVLSSGSSCFKFW